MTRKVHVNCLFVDAMKLKIASCSCASLENYIFCDIHCTIAYIQYTIAYIQYLL